MKRTIAIFLAVIVLSVLAFYTVNAQTNRTFYYYPTQNIYYDVADRQYLFNDGITWTTKKTLPSGVILTKGSPKVTVYHPGKDVWVNNPGHVVKYKNYRVTKATSHRKAQKGKVKRG